MTDFQPFHCAANRIPVLRYSTRRLAERRPNLWDITGDGPIAGHDHLQPGRYSGTMELEMTVCSPLVTGEQSTEKISSGSREQHYVDVKYVDGKVFISPTAIKGMLSRAYEHFTASRFRVFGEHKEPLTYRGDAASALNLVPIRVVALNADGSFEAELLRGDTLVSADYKEGKHTYPTMRAAALQDSDRGHARLAHRMTVERVRRLAPHGGEIACHMTLCLHGDDGRGARYAYWQVTDILDRTTNRYVHVFDIHHSVTVLEERQAVTGYVCRTTCPNDKSSELFSRKHDERVFFELDEDGPEKVIIPAAVAAAYSTVIESYVVERARETKANLPQDKRHKPNRATSVGQDAGRSHLQVGDLAYAVLDGDLYDVLPDFDRRVLQVIPVMIGRHAYTQSPRALAQEQGVAPLKTPEEASPADRLFGYVIQAEEGDAPPPTSQGVAARGRISICAVDTSQVTVSTDKQLLSPLLSPKPQSARRFLTDRNGRTPKADDRPLGRDRLFTQGQLLGSAVYPTHRDALGGGFPAQAVAAPVLAGQTQDNVGVRMSVRSWIEPKSVIRCTLRFENLSPIELSVLKWILTPENLRPSNAKGPVGYLRLGLGKPLGLGAIEVRMVEASLQAHETLAAGYSDLSTCLGLKGGALSLNDLSLPDPSLGKSQWADALKRAAYGYDDRRPLRYMSLEENKVNNQTDSRTGEPKDGSGLAPADLTDAPPSPLHITKDDQKTRSKGASQWPRRGGGYRRR